MVDVNAGDAKRTPLYQAHRDLGARLVPFAGYAMPVQYEGIVKEHHAVRQRAGLFDVSHMGELELEGPEALLVADELVTNDVVSLPVGKALYTACCNEAGTILDDLIVYRRGPQRVLIVCNASNRDKISPHVAQAAEGRCTFDDRSDATALLALQGPRAEAILESLTPGAQKLGFFCLGEMEVASTRCLVARTGYTGEDGFELFCPNEHAAALWDALLRAGKAHELAPAGLGARDTLRLEAKLCLYGNDIDETTNPYEAGLGWVVKLDTGRDFVGRDALLEVKARGVERKLVGFAMRGRGIARHGYPIVDAEDPSTRLGTVTSGSPGPSVAENIGLGYVPVAHAKRGTRIGIEIRGKVVPAELVRTPFYKREK